ncbi:hypothetical protein OPQ81_003411 [Rhizoctonia solani]|nr:hypothetical protein OPQ81_003411 [Rhizoctonia solani]
MHRTAGATAAKLTYGYDIQDESDEYIVKDEQTVYIFAYTSTLGRSLVDSLPFGGSEYLSNSMIPDLVLGGHYASKLFDFTEAPMKFVRTQLTKGCSEPSFVSSWLEKANNEDKPLIPWASGSIYGDAANTTVSVISTFFIAMLHHPETQRAAQAQIDQVVRSDRHPNFTDHRSFPYGEAIVKEVLGWQALAPIGITRILASKEDDEYKGWLFDSR